MGSVFISYSSKDRDRVAVIANTLRAIGLEVWWDREIPVATTYHEHIKKQLDEAQAVLVVWSPASVASQYVLWEAQRAHRRGILVPVVIEEADLPPDFFLIQAADLTRWRGNPTDPEWKRLTGALSRLVSQDVAAATATPVSPAPTVRQAKAPPPAAKANPVPPLRPRPTESAPAAPRPWYTRRSGMAALGGAGLLAVVIAVIAMSVGGTDPTTTLAGGTTVVATTIALPSSTAAPITTTTVPPTTIAPPPVPDLAWSRIWSEGSEVLGGPGDQKMLALVAWGSEFVAVGEDSTGPGGLGGAVWISADGSAWDKVAGKGVMYGITVGGAGLVAVGSFLPQEAAGLQQEAAGVWTSTDTISWDPVPYDPDVFGGPGARMLAVAAAGARFVAVGEKETEAGAAWTSVDGITWERVDVEVGRGVISSVVWGGPLGFVAAGRAESMNGEWDAAVWTSDDGLTWERAADSDFGGGSDQWINAVTTGGPGLVAVGGEGSPADGDIDAAVWTSSDGHEWTRVGDVGVLGGEGLQEMFGVAAGALGLIAVGSDTSGGDWDAAVWTSSNGTTWEQVVVPRTPDDPGVFDAGQMRAVIVTDSGVVGVGIIAWGSGEVIEGQPIGAGEETDAVGWVGLPVGTE